MTRHKSYLTKSTIRYSVIMIKWQLCNRGCPLYKSWYRWFSGRISATADCRSASPLRLRAELNVPNWSEQSATWWPCKMAKFADVFSCTEDLRSNSSMADITVLPPRVRPLRKRSAESLSPEAVVWRFLRIDFWRLWGGCRRVLVVGWSKSTNLMELEHNE